jgi:hypothetical protein
MSRVLLICSVVLPLILTAGSARADSADAADFAARAQLRLKQDDRRGAVDYLEKAFACDPRQEYAYQLAEQFEDLANEGGDPRDAESAVTYLRRAIANEKDLQRVEDAESRIKRLEARFASGAQKPPAQAAATPASGTAETPAAASAPVPAPAPLTTAAEPGAASAAVPAPPAPAAPPRPVEAPAPPPYPPPHDVAVSFLAGDGAEEFQIDVAGKSCVTPCTIPLHPGPYVMRTSGAATRKISLYVKDGDGAFHIPPTGTRLLIPGIALTVTGLVVATSFWAFGEACIPSLNLLPTPCQLANDTIWPILGSAALITGISFLGYYGSHDVGSLDMEPGDKPSGSSFRLASLGVQPVRNGAVTGAGFSF